MLEKESVGDTSKQVNWTEKTLFDYFAGQEIEVNTGVLPTPVADSPESQQTPPQSKGELPAYGFDTHAMSFSGVEMITKGGTAFVRTSTTAKTWKQSTLIYYFKDGTVINALPDAPDEQLPTASLKTHAFTPDEQEIVTYKDRYWKRKTANNDWQTGFLKDYFADCKMEKGSFPLSYWDIHTFSPSGLEIIIVGDTVWSKDPSEPQWKTKPLNDYFGPELPLAQHVTEKQKIDAEIQKKQFLSLKEKVMNELMKFFRPELVNRFDEVIMFEPLRFEHMTRIVKIQLKGVQKAMEDQDMGFVCSEGAIKEIARNGFDSVFGARPLRRAIQRLIENPISGLIIEKKVNAGDEVYVEFDGQQFIFNIQKAAVIESKASTDKKFVCELCAAHFSTEIVKNATVICSYCGSPKVQEAFDVEKPQAQSPQEPAKDAKDMTTVGKDENSNGVK